MKPKPGFLQDPPEIWERVIFPYRPDVLRIRNGLENAMDRFKEDYIKSTIMTIGFTFDQENLLKINPRGICYELREQCDLSTGSNCIFRPESEMDEHLCHNVMEIMKWMGRVHGAQALLLWKRRQLSSTLRAHLLQEIQQNHQHLQTVPSESGNDKIGVQCKKCKFMANFLLNNRPESCEIFPLFNVCEKMYILSLHVRSVFDMMGYEKVELPIWNNLVFLFHHWGIPCESVTNEQFSMSCTSCGECVKVELGGPNSRLREQAINFDLWTTIVERESRTERLSGYRGFCERGLFACPKIQAVIDYHQRHCHNCKLHEGKPGQQLRQNVVKNILGRLQKVDPNRTKVLKDKIITNCFRCDSVIVFLLDVPCLQKSELCKFFPESKVCGLLKCIQVFYVEVFGFINLLGWEPVMEFFANCLQDQPVALNQTEYFAVVINKRFPRNVNVTCCCCSREKSFSFQPTPNTKVIS